MLFESTSSNQHCFKFHIKELDSASKDSTLNRRNSSSTSQHKRNHSHHHTNESSSILAIRIHAQEINGRRESNRNRRRFRVDTSLIQWVLESPSTLVFLLFTHRWWWSDLDYESSNLGIVGLMFELHKPSNLWTVMDEREFEKNKRIVGFNPFFSFGPQRSFALWLLSINAFATFPNKSLSAPLPFSGSMDQFLAVYRKGVLGQGLTAEWAHFWVLHPPYRIAWRQFFLVCRIDSWA